MKKKIAVFANGWNSLILTQFMTGLKSGFPQDSVDSFLFLCHGNYAQKPELLRSEFNIFRLPCLETFDAAVVFGAGLNFADEMERLNKQLTAAGIPVVSEGNPYEGFHCLSVDNIVGTEELSRHLIEEHNVRNVVLIAGPEENEDSRTRINTVRNVMKTYDLSLEDDDVFYSNWDNFAVYDFIKEYFEKGRKMPDAFICANDGLAISCCLALEREGYAVPKDTLVTGFDCLIDGQSFYPSISSVDQRFDYMGVEAANAVMKILNGESLQEELVIPCKFVAGESCGCGECRNEIVTRRIMGREAMARRMDDTLLEGELYKIETSILGCNDYDTMCASVRRNFANDSSVEGMNFYMMLDSEYKARLNEEKLSLVQDGFASQFDVVIAKCDGKLLNVDKCTRRELIPNYNPSGPNHSYIVLPIYNEPYSLGYMIMDLDMKLINRISYQKVVKRWNVSFSRFRQNAQLLFLNKRLGELMQTDALTHVKNRIAYENYANQIQKQIVNKEISDVGMIMFDVNDLKKVNDALGHEAGDEYIRNCAKLICDTFKRSPVFRIGGDEFLVILVEDDYLNRDKLLQALRSYMAKLATENVIITEKISMASGMATLDAGSDNSISDVFKRADFLMYQNKAEMKKGNVR